MLVKEWLTDKLADELGIDPKSIDCDADIEHFDLDSLSLISIAYDIENEFGLDEIDPSVFQEFNTINKLAHWVQHQR